MGEAIVGFFGGIVAAAAGVLLFGTLSFWVASFIFFGVMVALTEYDRNVLAGILMVAFIALMTSANDISIVVHPTQWLKWAVVYMVIGSAWCFGKWQFFLLKARDKLRELKEQYLERGGIELVNGVFKDEDWPKFAEYLNGSSYKSYLFDEYKSAPIKKREDVIPTVRGRYSHLVRWIVWWPFSAFWTLLNDPITRLAKALVRLFKSSLTRMAQRTFRGEV